MRKLFESTACQWKNDDWNNVIDFIVDIILNFYFQKPIVDAWDINYIYVIDQFIIFQEMLFNRYFYTRQCFFRNLFRSDLLNLQF